MPSSPSFGGPAEPGGDAAARGSGGRAAGRGRGQVLDLGGRVVVVAVIVLARERGRGGQRQAREGGDES